MPEEGRKGTTSFLAGIRANSVIYLKEDIYG